MARLSPSACLASRFQPAWAAAAAQDQSERERVYEAGSSSALTSSGSPRSGNGISIASKSRGTTVFAKTARASSRISRGK